MPLPVDPAQRDDHYRRPPSLRDKVVKKVVEEVTGAVDSAVSARGGFTRGATSGAASTGFSRGGGGLSQMRLWAGPEADIDRVVEPAPWLPTSVGAVRASSVESFRVESYDDGKKIIYAVQLRLHSGEELGLRDVFIDDISLAVWVDACFPGSAFLTAWPGALDQPQPAD